jgi:hypothetical protein
MLDLLICNLIKLFFVVLLLLDYLKEAFKAAGQCIIYEDHSQDALRVLEVSKVVLLGFGFSFNIGCSSALISGHIFSSKCQDTKT